MNPSPTKRDWLAGAAHVSQVLSAIVLLTTVVFSWRTWQEARLVREEQARFFLAEKAPRLTVTKAFFNDSMLMVEIVNEGGSDALDVSIAKEFVRADGSRTDEWEFAQIQRELVQGSEITRLHVTDAEMTKNILGYVPSGFEAKPVFESAPGKAVLRMAVNYSDVFGNRRRKEVSFVALQ